MKAITNTTISLGLINLPVGVAKATGEAADVKFNLGNAKGEKLTQQYVDPSGAVVPRDEQTKVYEGHIIPKDQIDAIDEQTKLPALTIDKIEPREKFLRESHRITGSYFLQSQKKGGNVNGMKLFADTLRDLDAVAVTKITLRSRQYQFVIWPDAAGLLRGSTMVFAEDCRSADEDVRAHLAGQYSDQEKEMAKMLLGALMSGDQDPLMTDVDAGLAKRKALVEKVVGGGKVPTPEPVEKQEANAALADALAASLAAIKDRVPA